MIWLRVRLLLVCITVLCSAGPFGTRAVSAQESATSFEKDVRPILKKHCFHCHGEEAELSGGLDLRLVRFMVQGGDSGTSLIAGDAAGSLLMQRLRDGEMPPDESKQLSPEEIETIQTWINAGANTLRPEPESIENGLLITEEERSHWAFQPVRRPDVPTVQNTDQVANPIDAFLLARLEQAGFSFSQRAALPTLVRRLHFDLHGLPPDLQTMEAFPQSTAADADTRQKMAQLIDTLLQSPRYGERWARHWLDVAGYADSEGYNDVDAERPHAWRYRDYVIRAFNNDMPFDQFITEQLAGDELITSPLNSLSPQDTELLAATGFLRMAPDGTGGSVPDANVARNDTIADTIRIVSTSLMGMTVGCAQCHDHRYDPISQADYYQFRAIFDPALDWQKWKNPRQRLISLYTDADREQAAEIEAEAKEVEKQRTEQQQQFIQATFEKQLAKLPEDLHAAARTAFETPAKERTAEQNLLLKQHPSLNVSAGSLYLYDQKAADKLAEMANKAKEIRAKKPTEEFVRALTEVAGQIPTSHLFYRGDHEQPKQEVQPAGLTVVSMSAELPQIPHNEEQRSTSGRRLALAKRLTSPDYPLTARVIVNRVWMHHFGQGLVPTPGDFGVLGTAPTHPQLLDWLAAEFMDSGWSLKHLHRLILNSTAWQQQLRNSPEMQTADPDNLLYGGARLIRLDAEVFRDSVLAVSGKLNDKQFGPPVPVMADRVGRFVIGKENLDAGRPGKEIDMEGEQYRRSIYVQVRRSRPLAVLESFDTPAMTPNCDMRRPSTSSTQSLMLLNSDQIIDYSRFIADRVRQTAGEADAARIELAWQLVYSRTPEESEQAQAQQFLKDQTAIFSEHPDYQPKADSKELQPVAADDALAVLCQMLLSSNEFLYID